MIAKQGNQKSTDKLIYINFGLNFLSKRGILLLLKAKLTRKKIIVHWIGSDVYNLLLDNKKSRIKKKMAVLINKCFSINNWSAAPLLQQELLEIGIESELLYLPTELVRATEIEPLPSVHSFISYLPDNNHEFYGSKMILKLAENNPEVLIHIVANNGREMPKLKNVIYHGWVDEVTMDRLYNESFGVIRLPMHDALGGTVIEAVLRGRYAIWSFEADYVFTAINYEQLEKSVLEILQKNEPNFAGAEYVKENFNYDLLQAEFMNKIYNLLSS